MLNIKKRISERAIILKASDAKTRVADQKSRQLECTVKGRDFR